MLLLPTPVRILKQGADLLFYRESRSGDIPTAQNKLFHHLVMFGNNVDAPGSIIVVVVRGEEPDREMIVYDHMTLPPEQPQWVPTTSDSIERFIAEWFDDRRGRR